MIKVGRHWREGRKEKLYVLPGEPEQEKRDKI